ncbi:MAG TPA: hypothetical protein VLM42_12590 [Bryobacteraceae bacterium]|nr:hypothetical protein [Bryobacteraceae bacterium]
MRIADFICKLRHGSMAEKKARAAFVEPMLLLRTENLPEGKDWLYELKFDGYRALAIKSGGRVQLRSRNDNDFTAWYSSIADALSGLPDDTVIDGEVVALDADGKPSFNMLQNYGSAGAPLHFFVFDWTFARYRTISTGRKGSTILKIPGEPRMYTDNIWDRESTGVCQLSRIRLGIDRKRRTGACRP